MDVRVDSKGKTFTQQVTKRRVPVRIRTLNGDVTGHIFVHPDRRIKDDLNDGEQFIAVVDAVVFDPTGMHPRYRVDFLVLNTTHVVFIAPESDSQS